jgi:type IV pilus assembly protein PilC
MPYFEYKVKDEKGRDYKGYIEAKSKKDAIKKLSDVGFYLTHVKWAPFYKLNLFSSRNITNSDLTLFARQFASMINAGIPMVKALYAVGEETENPRLKEVIQKLRKDVESGNRLSDSLAKNPKIFSPFFISLVRTGETAGKLDEMLERLALNLEKEEELRRKIRTAFMYPSVVLFVSAVVVIYLLVFVVPVFQSIYRSMKITLPGPTVTLIFISGFVRNYWPVIAGAAAVFSAGFFQVRRTEQGRILTDRLKLKIPMIGPLMQKEATSRFIRSFAAMFAGGIQISKALEVSKEATDNAVITDTVEKMKQSINKGESISAPLKKKRVFPTTVIQMISAGEESGYLDKMLEKSADFLDNEIDTIIKRLVIKIEPVLTFMLAIVVGFIALAIYLPMFDIIKQLTH